MSHDRNPPTLAVRLMHRVLDSRAAHHGVLGDLREEYQIRSRSHSRIVCDVWFWRQAVLVYWRFRRERRQRSDHQRSGGRGDVLVTFLGDIRFALRGVRRNPGFSVVVILTLSLGIGATTTIFSLVNGILLSPLQYTEPDRIVSVWPENWYSTRFFDLLEDQVTSYDAVAAWKMGRYSFIDENGASQLQGPRVSARFFEVLGSAMSLGRAFQPGDDELGAEDVVILSHGFWRRRFGEDPNILGRRIRLGEVNHTVVGVLRADFDLLQPDAEVVTPWVVDPAADMYGSAELKVVGRLKGGVTPEQARAELGGVVAQVREQYSLPADWGVEADVVPLQEYLVGEIRPTLLLLFGSVGLILLIATANVANLFLTRSLSRQREISVRIALGASPFRVVRQLVTESSVLGLLGALPGIVFAFVGLRVVLGLLSTDVLMPTDLPHIDQVKLDMAVLGFCVLLALLTGWLAGLMPAVQAAKTNLRDSVSAGSRSGTESGGRRRIRAGIVIAEIALTAVLLSGSGLLIKSFWRITQVDPGLQVEGLLTFRVTPEPGRFETASALQVYYEALDRRFEAIAGVQAVSGSTQLPFSPDGGINEFYPIDQPPSPGSFPPIGRWRPVTPGYFATAKIPLVEGRLFSDADGENSETVALLSETAARMIFPDRDAIGRSIIVGIERELPIVVVGIVGDVRVLGLTREAPGMVYRPFAQVGPVIEGWGAGPRAVMLRTSGDPYAVLPQVRTAVSAVDRNALISDIRTMSDIVSASLTSPRVTLVIVSFFAAVALLLGAIGVYGVMGYTVRERTREISIRVALGASREVVLREVMMDGLKIAVLGTTIGMGLGLAFSRLIESFMFEVTASDPWVMMAAIGASLTVALIATLVPARRAGLVDPIEALSAE